MGSGRNRGRLCCGGAGGADGGGGGDGADGGRVALAQMGQG